MADRIGVAINACGAVAYEHARAYLQDGRAEIVGVTSRRRESAERLIEAFGLACRIYPDYEALLDDSRVQAVSITTPNYRHAREATAAARAGKHILLEKPAGINHEELTELAGVLYGSSLTTLVSFVLRWNPLVENLTRLRDAGAFGDLFFIQTDYWHGAGSVIRPDRWISRREYTGSAFLAGGSHAVDLARHFAGEITSVAAFSARLSEGFDFDTTICATLRLAGGGVGRVSVSFDPVCPYQFNIEFLGTEGSARQDRVWSRRLTPAQNDFITIPCLLPDSGAVAHHPFGAEIGHFLDCIAEGRDGRPSILDAITTSRVCLAVDESAARGGEPVVVRD